jgi:hypothetical protein
MTLTFHGCLAQPSQARRSKIWHGAGVATVPADRRFHRMKGATTKELRTFINRSTEHISQLRALVDQTEREIALAHELLTEERLRRPRKRKTRSIATNLGHLGSRPRSNSEN